MREPALDQSKYLTITTDFPYATASRDVDPEGDTTTVAPAINL